MLRVVIDLLALAAQVTGLVVWPLIEGGREPSLWYIPLALILTSFGWWENFVSKKSALGKIINKSLCKLLKKSIILLLI